ncbi:MAG TPA: ATP-binding protein [Polyangiaceae bacterium]
MDSPFILRLTQHREALVERFLREVEFRDVAPEGVIGSELRDSLPQLLDEIVAALRRNLTGSLIEHSLPAAAEHGAHRWRQGFDLRAVVREYGVLENVVYRDLEEQGIEPSLAEVRAFQNCLNSGLALAVFAYSEEADVVRRTLGEKQEALGATELRLAMIAEHVPQMIWTADARGHVEWMNPRWFEFTGVIDTRRAADENVGAEWFEVVHPDDRKRVESRWQRAVENAGPYEIEARFRGRSGEYRWFLGRAVPVLDSHGRLSKWFGSFTDIDDQKRTEARVNAAREEGDRLNRLKDEFLATVSHELRTPLQSMLGWARLLRSGHVKPEQTGKALETIERNALVQSQLIEDILDVSRIITGKARIHSHVVDVAVVLGAALDTTQPAARAKGVELAADVPPDIGTVMGDSDRLQQVVWNLLSNAVKFTPSGGHVRLTAKRTPTELHLVVTDDGQGIAPTFLPFVFDRFRQAEAGVARSQGGLGLGLAIVRHLVELHGGRVEAASDGFGRGASFSVNLPVAGAPAGEPPPALGRAPRSEPPVEALLGLSGLRVLVVDDQSDARDIIATILEQYGAEVRVAESTAVALDALKNGPFDVLVSDIGMPGDDGYVLIEKVRAMLLEQPEVARIPAVALTAYARNEDERRALAAGYDAHVAKPVDPRSLVSTVMGVARRAAKP